MSFSRQTRSLINQSFNKQVDYLKTNTYIQLYG